MFENFDSENLKQEAYQKASSEVGQEILDLLKSGPDDKGARQLIDEAEVRDLPALKAKLYQKDVMEKIQIEIKKLNQKYHFGLDNEIIYEKSLQHILEQRARHEIAAADYPDFSLVEDMYLDLFGEELLKEYQQSNQDFTEILNEKMTILRQKNIIPDEKINDRMALWYEKSYTVEKTA